jgi:uncharacterized protein
VAGLAVWIAVAISVAVFVARNGWREAGDPLIEAARNGDAERCESIVKSGRAVDATNGDDSTALTWAVFYCKKAVVERLLELGADVNHANAGGFTPLMYTATSLRGHQLHGTPEERNEIALILIEHGADVNRAMGDGRTIGDGQTALHFAAQSRNPGLVRLLLSAGAKADVKSNQGFTPLDVAKFPDYAPNDGVISLLEGRPR